MSRSRKRKKKDEDDEEIDSNAWMVTFSDLLTLLMTFFVLLLTMSSMDTKALRSMFSTFTGAANVLGFSENAGIEPVIIIQPKISSQDIQKILTRVMDDYVKGKLHYELSRPEVSVNKKKNSVLVTFPAKILFDRGKYNIKKDISKVLKDIAGVIKDTDYLIRIEGHTDDDLIGSSEEPLSNWKLSALRAAEVMKFFLAEDIPADRLNASGHGDLNPVFLKDDRASRYKNRRVDIILERVLL